MLRRLGMLESAYWTHWLITVLVYSMFTSLSTCIAGIILNIEVTLMCSRQWEHTCKR